MTEEEWSKKTCGECGKRRTKSYMSKGNTCKYCVCDEWDSGKYGQHVRDDEKACDYFVGQAPEWIVLLVLVGGGALSFLFILLMRWVNNH